MKNDTPREYPGRIVRLEMREVVLPNGHRMEIDVVHHPGGAGVVAINDKAKVCLVKQYRPVFDEWLWEIPAGKRDHGEPPLETARRELAEEAGVNAARWQELGYMISSPGVFIERVYLYLARDLTRVPVSMAADEVLEVHWLDLEQVRRDCLDGRILDAKTVIGILRAGAHYQGAAGNY